MTGWARARDEDSETSTAQHNTKRARLTRSAANTLGCLPHASFKTSDIVNARMFVYAEEAQPGRQADVCSVLALL